MIPAANAIRAIGCSAHAALERSDGALAALAESVNTPYARAAGEIVWIGAGNVAMHPRAIVLHDARMPPGNARLRLDRVVPWRPVPLAIDAAGIVAMQAGCALLRRDLRRLGEPRGLAVWLAGEVPPFPLDRLVPWVHRLTQAFDAGDVAAVGDAGLHLLGAGLGLTPSGDDLVGAALFARRMIAARSAEACAWRDLAVRLAAAAHTRTHAIGAALFGDLVRGESFAPLHELAAVLSGGAGRDQAVAAARDLVAIGHSSGWEMLAGFIIGAGTRASPSARSRKIATTGLIS